MIDWPLPTQKPLRLVPKDSPEYLVWSIDTHRRVLPGDNLLTPVMDQQMNLERQKYAQKIASAVGVRLVFDSDGMVTHIYGPDKDAYAKLLK